MLVHISLRSGTLDVETASESTRTLRSMMKVLFLSYLLAHRIKRLQGTSRKLMNPSSTFTTFMSHTRIARVCDMKVKGYGISFFGSLILT